MPPVATALVVEPIVAALMDTPTIVIIARADHTPALRKRLADHAFAIFCESESLQAMQAIEAHPPRLVALDPTFVTTARGAVLVASVKSNPRLARVDLRILAHDEDMPLILAQAAASEAAVFKTCLPLDRCGTRLQPRYPTHGEVAAIVNGERCEVIDLSLGGAQIMVPARLRPDQPLRITLFDRQVQTQCRGSVAWSNAVPSGGAMRYRAGVKFADSDLMGLEPFCRRHARTAERSSFDAA